MTTLHLLLILLLACGVAQSSKTVRVSPLQFTGKDTKEEEEEDCSMAQPRKSTTNIPLMHVQAKCSPFRNNGSTWLSVMLESIKGDEQCYRAITQGATSFTTQEDAGVPLAVKKGSYVINLGFGTPQQSFYTLLDTGSEITWIPCAACTNCSGDVFDPSKSSTFEYVNCTSKVCGEALGSCGNEKCRFRQRYADGSEVNEWLSNDSLAVGSQSLPGFIFGYANSLSGLISSSLGLVGFGSHGLSFVSQTVNLFQNTFSYCLPNSDSTGCLDLGIDALNYPDLQFTSLLSDASNPTFYYVRLIAISVGAQRVLIDSATIIDSGTTITRLVEPFYSAVRDTFLLQFKNYSLAAPYGIFDMCFYIHSGGIKVPQITLHFDRDVNVSLPSDNFLIRTNVEGSVACLAFAPPLEEEAPGISVFGNFQQRNFRYVYDIPGSRLGIAPQSCNRC
ncbi:hypothetical protein SUGI_0824140 [Cryptomeria japonica]|uniref:aspartyl protease AED3-like n=1 Tax=Cryptomeria japonica TaxID=3369 RepID=UPI002414895F|nr:aspartyl protease AED3-like [Cryptomeria japonica]GLJ40183.1 hypothetical protein SUGI_0824140 [Cryptomeria japonica]